MSNKKLKIVSLFSGVGGFEEGLKNSGIPIEIVFASEIDKYAKLAYKSNFNIKNNIYGDISKINDDLIPEHDILCAGFPCQAFSIAGRMKGFNDTRGTLFFEVARILNNKKPKYIILENVKNLISHDNGNTIKIILKILNDIGYSLDFTIINSSEAGLPQSRDRIYILGVYNLASEKYTKDIRSRKVTELKNNLNSTEFKGFNFFNKLTFENKKLYLKDIILNNVEDEYFILNDGIKNFIKYSNVKDVNQDIHKIIKLFDLPKDIYNDLERQRRVYSIRGISPTILARSDSTKIYIKNNKNELSIRKLTPEETFYAQGFNKQFVNNIKKAGISKTQMYKQAGNAVSPPVIKEIFKNLIDLQSQENKFTFIDLFCGLGGFRLAFESLGGKCVFSSDIDEHAREIYNINFGEYPYGDITKIHEKSIPEHDILCAGFPCQPFSIAGKRLGFEDTRGTLFFDLLRILKEKRPKAFFLENVSGIMSHNKGNTLDTIEKLLNGLGYDIHYKVINAKDIGYPQNRSRWYCIGINKKLLKNNQNITFNFPEKRKLYYTLDSLIQDEAICEYNITNIAKKNIYNHIEKFKQNKRYNKNNKLIANEVRKSRCNFRCDGISPCLTAKMGTGGNNIPILVKEKRKLTERECLRIMGFPDDYYIKPNNHQSYKQIGNSVIVPIIKEIGENLINIINKFK